MAKGNLFIISAPSGAGKTSLVKALLEQDKQLSLSVSYTTREPRPGEQNGVHYHFVDQATFEAMLTADEFLEHAKVFDRYYGTARKALENQLSQGKDVILEIDWQGAAQVREHFTDAVSLYILPPSRPALENRLRARKQDSDEVINRRMSDAISEMSHFTEFDYVIINDRFQKALDDLQCVINAQRLRLSFQQSRHRELLDRLLA